MDNYNLQSKLQPSRVCVACPTRDSSLVATGRRTVILYPEHQDQRDHTVISSSSWRSSSRLGTVGKKRTGLMIATTFVFAHSEQGQSSRVGTDLYPDNWGWHANRFSALVFWAGSGDWIKQNNVQLAVPRSPGMIAGITTMTAAWLGTLRGEWYIQRTG